MNTIHPDEEPHYPGDLDIENKIRGWVQWNAMAMVVKANRDNDGLGGHISTFASSAVLYEVGFNHFFRGNDGEFKGDQIFFQGHASPRHLFTCLSRTPFIFTKVAQFSPGACKREDYPHILIRI